VGPVHIAIHAPPFNRNQHPDEDLRTAIFRRTLQGLHSTQRTIAWQKTFGWARFRGPCGRARRSVAAGSGIPDERPRLGLGSHADGPNWCKDPQQPRGDSSVPDARRRNRLVDLHPLDVAFCRQQQNGKPALFAICGNPCTVVSQKTQQRSSKEVGVSRVLFGLVGPLCKTGGMCGAKQH